MRTKADELFRPEGVDYRDTVGGIVINDLIQRGVLPRNLNFHLQSLPAAERAESFAHATKVALQLEAGDMPEWALPGHKLPDVLTVRSNVSRDEVRTLFEDIEEPYYSVHQLASTIRGDANTEQWSRRSGTVALMTWSRLLEQIHPHTRAQFQYLRELRTQANADYEGIDLKYARRVAITTKYICDKALYDFVTMKLLDRRAYVKGVGKLAVLGVGTMLFKNGEHPDLMDYAEQLDDYAAGHDK